MARKEEPTAAELRARLERKRRRDREWRRRTRRDDTGAVDATCRHDTADACRDDSGPSSNSHDLTTPGPVPHDEVRRGTGTGSTTTFIHFSPLLSHQSGASNGHATANGNGHALAIVRQGNWLTALPRVEEPAGEIADARRRAAAGVRRGFRLRLRHAQLLLQAEALGLKRKTPQHRDWMALAYARAIAEERARDGEPWG